MGTQGKNMGHEKSLIPEHSGRFEEEIVLWISVSPRGVPDNQADQIRGGYRAEMIFIMLQINLVKMLDFVWSERHSVYT